MTTENTANSSWKFLEILGTQPGMVLPDAYNTAWVALVPQAENPANPAWPQALAFLRESRLDDGGWGSPEIYFAHGRTISTLAALRTFLAWGMAPGSNLVKEAVSAIERYAHDLRQEPDEPIGFELLLPRLAVEVERFGVNLPAGAWTGIKRIADQKMALIGALKPDYEQPRSWWFSMELLLEYQLARIEKKILNDHGSIVTSPAATAAYLRALRLAGRDSVEAHRYLDQVVRLGQGGAGVCWPIEGFEIVWTLDSQMRAGNDPDDPALTPLIRWVANYWENSPEGLSHSLAFPIKDGDHTAVGYKVLRWAGLNPSPAPLLRFWDGEKKRFVTYTDERTPSISANVHALLAFRDDPANAEHRQIAGHIVHWLRKEMRREGKLHDKWHFSPLYATSRVIPALIGLDHEFARACVRYLLDAQLPNGGWGVGHSPSLEESSYAILGLIAAWEAGLFEERRVLEKALAYLKTHDERAAQVPLWIGKTLYQPLGVTRAAYKAACAAAERTLGVTARAEEASPGS